EEADDEPSAHCILIMARREAACGFGRMKAPWRYRLTVRTEPSQGLNTGSIPVSATTNKRLTRSEVPPGATRNAPEGFPAGHPSIFRPELGSARRAVTAGLYAKNGGKPRSQIFLRT